MNEKFKLHQPNWMQLTQVFWRDFFSVLSSTVAFTASACLIWKSKLGLAATEQKLVNLLLAGAVGISLFLAVRLWARGKREQILGALGALVILGTFTAWHWDATCMAYFRWAQLFFLAHLLVALAPLRSPPGKFEYNNETDLWRFNWYMLTRFLFGVVFCLAMLLGLLGALFAMNALFDLKIESEVYGTTSAFVFFVASVFQVLSTITDTRVGAQSETVTRDIRRLVQYLFTPLALIYFVIAYSYMIKILIQREWPKGVVGWLVSALVVCVFITAVLQRPLSGDRKLPNWMTAFWNRSFLLLIAPLIVLLCAVWRRVDEYGWTNMRVTLLTLAGWALFVSVLNIKNGRRSISLIPLSLAFLLAVTLIGPLSPHFTSRLSQQAQFNEILQKNGGALSEGVYTWAKPVTTKDEKRLTSILMYACEEFGAGVMLELINDPGAKAWSQQNEGAKCWHDSPALQRAIGILKIEYRNSWDGTEQDLSKYFNIFDEAKYHYTTEKTQLGQLDFQGYMTDSTQVIRAPGMTFEYTCCKPLVTWIPADGSRHTIDVALLLTKKKSSIELKHSSGTLTIWMTKGTGRLLPEQPPDSLDLKIEGDITLIYVFSRDKAPADRTKMDPTR